MQHNKLGVDGVLRSWPQEYASRYSIIGFLAIAWPAWHSIVPVYRILSVKLYGFLARSPSLSQHNECSRPAGIGICANSNRI